MAIIFFDIDGTLATGTRVPESAAAAIARTRAAGNLVFICTGRPRWYAESNFGAYADGFVCCNGRLAVHGDEHVIEQPISQEQLGRIVPILDAHGAGYAFFGADQPFYGGDRTYLRGATAVHGPMGELTDAMASGEPLYSYDIFFTDMSERDAIARDLEDLCLVNPHGPHPSADVTVVGYGKGEAVRDVASALGIVPEDTYAFGDGINDIAMLEAAGHGIAMGNALPETKAVAEHVTADIDADGVALGLAHYGLA